MTRILFAYDGSERSRRALRYAERLGADDEVSVISVARGLIQAPKTAEYTDPASDPRCTGTSSRRRASSWSRRAASSLT